MHLTLWPMWSSKVRNGRCTGGRTSPCHHVTKAALLQVARKPTAEVPSAVGFCPHMLDVISLPNAKVLQERSEHSTANRTSIGQDEHPAV